MGLILSRKIGESIRIGDDIIITVREKHPYVKLDIVAPKDVNIVRTEIDTNPRPEYEPK